LHQLCTSLFPYTTLFRSDDAAIDRDLNSGRRNVDNVGGHRMRFAKPGMQPAVQVRVRFMAAHIECPDEASGPAAAFVVVHHDVRSEEHTSELQSRENLVY